MGPLIARVRLHVTTERFLAQRRGDTTWAAACDYAALALDQLRSRLHPRVLAEWICATVATVPGAHSSPQRAVSRVAYRAGQRAAIGGRR